MKVTMDNKPTVWITGASKGIGAAIAELLAEKGFAVAASARTPITSIHENIHPFVCDVQSPAEIAQCFQDICAHLGGVDVLITNAGVATFASLVDTTDEAADEMLGINLRGMFLSLKSVLPAMIARNSGVIVNILSVAAVKTFTNCAVYSATKAGALAMSRSVREEVRAHNVRVIDILAGATETAIWDDSARTEFHERMMQPTDIAQVVWQAIELSISGRMVLEEIVVRPKGGDL